MVAIRGAGGSVLVVDRAAGEIALADSWVVAHLAADEPAENARVVSHCYVSDEYRRCRPLTPEDLEVLPFGEDPPMDPEDDLRDGKGCVHALELFESAMAIPELRWCRRPAHPQHGPCELESVREAIACLESYEPVRAHTAFAIASNRDDPRVSVAALRAELERVDASRIVLNRGLRQAVGAITRSQGLSMSEIAIRCGRIKYDSRGNASGETSWLARRLGLLPDGGESSPSPWIHSDVLALIARRGLGISPREVELG